MGWLTQGYSSTTARWTFSAGEGGMIRRDYPTGGTSVGSLWYTSFPTEFNQNKTYIFQTTVNDFRFYHPNNTSFTYPKYLEIEVFGGTFGYEENPSNIWEDNRSRDTNVNKIFYVDSPNNTETLSTLIEYRTTYNNWGPPSDSNGAASIDNFTLIETDWIFQGWALDETSRTDGWHYDDNNDWFQFTIARQYGTLLISGGLEDTTLTGGSGYLQDDTGSDYIIEGGVGTASISTGSGWGLTVTFTVSGGTVSSVTPVAPAGHSFLPGDVISIPGGSTLATIEVDNVTEDSTSSLGSRKSIGGHTGSNYIAKYIEYPIFNISFDAVVNNSKLDVYLVENLDLFENNNTEEFFSNLENINLNGGQFLGSIESTTLETYTFYNLVGNRYILLNAEYRNNSLTKYARASNFVIDGSYQETDNNEQFLFTNSGSYSEPTELCLIGGSSDATYSVTVVNENTLHEQIGTPSNTFAGPTGFPGFFSNLYGDVINLNALNAKVGNGTFKAGIWENGVWNSGWRVDSNVYEFDDVEISLLMATTNTKWRIQLKGPQTSTQNFSVGDRVSIGNIVGIDINENRKLMKNYFTVLSVTNNNITVDFNNTFPLRRIEKDSENHKIKVSKNIWLNGGFLNGYFEGIWNGGLFKGFPYITEMYNTHWIDGKYDGGHFYGEYPEYTYVDTYYWGPTTPNTLGLTFGATAHGFEIGDLIEIDKDDKSINPQYDGFATVIDVIDDYLIIIDKGFGAASTDEGGTIKRRTGTAVIQNFEFYDNNIAKLTTKDTINLKQIYTYNSWVDVKYLDESASNLGRNLISYNDNVGEFSENNLYGYITRDVLSSISSFRNSFSLGKSIYSLGTKYKIYDDFIGEASEFNDPFSTSTTPGLDNFINDGWTYSIGSPEIERTTDQEMKVELSSGKFLLKNTNVSIERRRYSIVEFDLTEYEGTDNRVIITFSPFIFRNFPRLYITSPENTYIPGTYNNAFPESRKVRHTLTNNIKKYEYFFNNRNINIGLDADNSLPTWFFVVGGGGVTASFDNVKLYELDMIPFFQYMTEEYINKAVQVPYQGIAPFIDYTDSEFSFIDNIDIGLDSLSTEQSYNPPTGGGGIDDAINIFDLDKDDN